MSFGVRARLLLCVAVVGAVAYAGWTARGWFEDARALAARQAQDALVASFREDLAGVSRQVEERLRELRANELVIDRGSFVRSRNLCISVCVLSLMLSGCSTPLSVASLSPDQQNLLVRCPEVPAQLRDGTASEMVLVIREMATVYHDCAVRHNGLVDVLEGR